MAPYNDKSFFASSPTEESHVASVLSSSPLTSADSEERDKVSGTALLENENNSRQKLEDDSNDDDGGSNDEVVVEKIEVNGKEETPPKNKKTRRGKRKPKSSKSSGEQVSASASKRFLRCGCLYV